MVVAYVYMRDIMNICFLRSVHLYVSLKSTHGVSNKLTKQFPTVKYNVDENKINGK